jgi:hypothetical protein
VTIPGLANRRSAIARHAIPIALTGISISVAAAEARPVTSMDHRAGSLVVERQMPHPPQKIWRVLTQGLLIEDWRMAIPSNRFAMIDLASS